MDSEGPQFERCKFSILGIEANFDCDFRKWLCKCWIIYFLGGLPTKLIRTVLLWHVFFYFEVSMEMFNVSLKLFTQYLCRKIFQATPFTSHTLQLENSRVHIFRLYHVFFSACVCNMQWLVCSRKLANTASILSGNPRKDSVVSGLTWLEPLVCLHELSSRGEYRPLNREMESLATDNSNSSEANTEFEVSPDHTTSWKSAWWVIWDGTLLYLRNLYRSLPWPFLCHMHWKIHTLIGDFRVAFRLCFKASPGAKFSCGNYSHANFGHHFGHHFHMKGFALKLALK